MPAMDYESEITELKRRVDEMEREVDGEKMLSRHIYQKVQANERLLLDVQNSVVGQGAELAGLRADVNKLKTDVALLRAELPDIVTQAVIQAFREAR